MDKNLKKCLDSLNENEPEIRGAALQSLARLCDKIISFPNDNEYRRIRVSDPTISEKLLMAFGAIECLFEMGFIEDGEYFTLPRDASLSRLSQVQKAINDLRTKLMNEKTHFIGRKTKIHQKKSFLDRIVDESRHTLKYENPHLQSKARRVVPLEKLQIGAMEKMRNFQREMKSRKSGNDSNLITDHEITTEDFLLVELLDWFKNDFFTWMDSPSCNFCGKTCQYERVELSTDSRISRTEIHKCEDCGIEAKFPRYTDPGILLKTRRGRCGEWANAFTLICRSLGFDARLVHDETDHVWTEVWSIASNRWIHADPCENAIDRPLMYERGWKKKLTYVIAYSRDEIQDVTWRYTRDQTAVMKRRVLCSEHDLCSLICQLNEERQNDSGYSEARKRFVTKRRALELVELLPAPPGSKKPSEEENDEYEGRSSGSLAWRSSRGETCEKLLVPRLWKISREAKKFELRYYAAKDEYEAIVNAESITEKRAGWENGVETIEGGIFRKVETDWKMTYLARGSGHERGKIIWSFETVDPKISIKSLILRATCSCFHNGKIDWRLRASYGESEKPDVIFPIEDPENFAIERLNGAWKIKLIAELGGGQGNEAWQHAQVFRQSLNDRDQCSMAILIETCEWL